MKIHIWRDAIDECTCMVGVPFVRDDTNEVEYIALASASIDGIADIFGPDVYHAVNASKPCTRVKVEDITAYENPTKSKEIG